MDEPKTNAEEYKELDDKILSDEIGEEVKDGKVVEKEEPKEPPKEEPKETPEEKTARERDEKGRFVKKEEVDALKEEVKKEVSKETVDKITEALGGKDSTQEQKDRYQQISEEFFAKNGRNPTWFELIPFIKEDLKADMKAEDEARAKAEEETKQKLDEGQKVRREEFNKYIDNQLDDLYASNKLPKIVNKDDPQDYGVKARQALFQKMQDVNVERTKVGQPPIYSLKEIFYEHYTLPSREPAGADAPISAGRGGQPVTNNQETFTNEEIHNKSFQEIAEEGIRNRSS